MMESFCDPYLFIVETIEKILENGDPPSGQTGTINPDKAQGVVNVAAKKPYTRSNESPEFVKNLLEQFFNI